MNNNKLLEELVNVALVKQLKRIGDSVIRLEIHFKMFFETILSEMPKDLRDKYYREIELREEMLEKENNETVL